MLSESEKKPLYDGRVGIEKLHSQVGVYLVYLQGRFVGTVKNRVLQLNKNCSIEDTQEIEIYLKNYMFIN